MISLATSTVNKKVRDYIDQALDDNRLAQGRFIKEFEQKMADYLGAKHAIAVCNGSMADIVSLAACKASKPDKTEVIVPALTFIAQTNAVLINGLKPVFVDCKDDYQMNIEEIEKSINENTLAIMPVHLLGKACDIEAIMELAKKHDLLVVEDCCEAFGGDLDGKKFGTFGDFGAFSFYASHTLCTGEGGIIISNDDEMADLARAAMNHGRLIGGGVADKFHFENFGFNGKMSNILASIGCAVAELADDVIETRRDNVKYINEKIGAEWGASSPHCYPVMYNSEEERDEKLKVMTEEGVECRKLFSCLPTQENVYIKMGFNTKSYPVAEDIGRRGLFLPIHQHLSTEELNKICNLI